MKKKQWMNMTLLLCSVFFLSLLTINLSQRQQPNVVGAATGFDQYGYNYTARLFNGTGMSWCEQRGITIKANCEGTLGGAFTNDKLVMKWSKGWDDARFHGAAWGPEAWEDNEWNGMVAGGSKAVWHYKIIWVGPQLESSPYWREGGYGIWGQFEVIMDQGTDKLGAYPSCFNNKGGHAFCALTQPNGYGSNK